MGFCLNCECHALRMLPDGSEYCGNCHWRPDQRVWHISKYRRIFRRSLLAEERRQEPPQEEEDEHLPEPQYAPVPAGPGNGNIAENIPSEFRRNMGI